MVQRVKYLAAERDYLHLLLGTHLLERENLPPQGWLLISYV